MSKLIRFGLWLGIVASMSLARTAYANVRIVLDSVSLDFGNVDITSFKELTLQIRDTSIADVQIDAIDPVSGNASLDFKVMSPSFPAVVSAGGSAVLSVVIRFTPGSLGQRNALLLIQTTDGNLTVPLTGTGTTEVSSLAFSISGIDFGLLSPGLRLDTVVELYSIGLDSATIFGTSITNGSGDTTFVAEILYSSIESPFKVAPGDSVAIRISVNGNLPLGAKQAQLSIIGATSSPAITLAGDVEWASFAVDPTDVDFGVMYAGEVHDTIVHIKNTGDAALSINEIDPPSSDFSVFKAPTLPIFVRAGDSVDLTIRANPGLNTVHQSHMSAISKNVLVSSQRTDFTLTVPGSALRLPQRQALNVSCAIPGTIDVTVPITDTISRSFAISRVLATDTSVVVHSAVPFPDTIGAGMTQSLGLQIDPSTISTNRIVLQFFGGDQVIASDTLDLTNLPSSAAIALAALPDSDSSRRTYDVRTQTALVPFVLDTLIIHIASSSTNAAEIDSASIALAPGLTNARVIGITRDTNGYAVTIVSSVPIVAATGSSILSFSVNRFVSNEDSARLVIWVETPERGACLEWKADTGAVPTLATCGSNDMRALMTGSPLLFDIRLGENPVSGPVAHLTIAASAAASLTCEITDAGGVPRAQIAGQLEVGQNDVELPLASLPSGSYYLRIAAHGSGASRVEVRTLHFIKRD